MPVETTNDLLTSINPATGEVIQRVECDSPAAVEQRLQQAAAAFQWWRQTSFAERRQVLRTVARRLRDQREQYASPMIDEMGKPRAEALGEVAKAAWCADHYADHAADYLAREIIHSDAVCSYVQYLPLGVILGILPWNAPFWLAFRFAAPALMAGNTCLMKHDPHVPACALAIADAFEATGCPEGIFQPLLLQTPAVEGVIRDWRVKAVSFTGSSRGGSAVAAIAASEIKPAVLELGGSDPCIVLADADLAKAADTVVLSRIINAGQSCIAAKRIIIESPIYDEFLTMLQERLAAFKVGNPADPETQVGPIARKDLRTNLHRQVTETIGQGARCLLGGELPPGPGYFYPVTLLADVTPGMCAFQEETFGPVAVAMRAENEAHALALANDTPYGLGASIWTASAAKGERWAKSLETGQVSVNGIVKTDPRLPSGGIKKSGYGRELGPHGIKEFVNAQQVWIGESAQP